MCVRSPRTTVSWTSSLHPSRSSADSHPRVRHRSPFAAHWRIDMVKGLGTVVYHVPDLDRAKLWYSTAFRQQPYFDQPFYVGFNIAGYELGLDPNTPTVPPGGGGRVAYR